MEGEPIWLPEIGLGLGRERGIYLGREREWLYWYDNEGHRLLTPEEKVEQEQTRAERLAEKLRELGVDPDSL